MEADFSFPFLPEKKRKQLKEENKKRKEKFKNRASQSMVLEKKRTRENDKSRSYTI